MKRGRHCGATGLSTSNNFASARRSRGAPGNREILYHEPELCLTRGWGGGGGEEEEEKKEEAASRSVRLFHNADAPT